MKTLSALIIAVIAASTLACATKKSSAAIDNSEYTLSVPPGWAVTPIKNRPQGTEIYENVVVVMNPKTEAIVVVGLLPEKVPSLRIIESLTLVALQNGFTATEPSFSDVVENGTTLEIIMDTALVRFLILDGPNKTIVIQGQTQLNRISYESVDTLLKHIKVKQ